MSFDLFDGVRVRISQPRPPVFRIDPIEPTRVTVVPIAGPAGAPGEGLSDELIDQIDEATAHNVEQDLRLDNLESSGPGSGGLRSYRHVQNAPAAVVLINHPLTFTPAGIRCTDTLDQITEPDKIHNPQLGVTEVIFGAPFSGDIDLS